MKRLALLPVALALWLSATAGATAHTRDRVFSSWVVDGGSVTAIVRMPARLAPQAAGNDGMQSVVRHFFRTLNVSLGAHPCRPLRGAAGRSGPDGNLSLELTWSCHTAADASRLTLEIGALFGEFPNLVHFARLRLPGGRMEEHVFTAAARLYTADLPPGGGELRRSWFGLMTDYIGLGITHILAGADHLAFVLGLMLIARGVRALMFIITGFTLGHSLTLALAATGALTPASAAVEALIGFTVAIVAVEAAGKAPGRDVPPAAAALALSVLSAAALLLGSALPPVAWAGLVLFTLCYLPLSRRRTGSRWAVALAAMFGLVHGFGFAGVLQEIGLPENRLVPALLGFNTGVEAGQILVVALALAAARGMARLLPERACIWSTQAFAATLCGLGVFWFVTRAFAG